MKIHHVRWHKSKNVCIQSCHISQKAKNYPKILDIFGSNLSKMDQNGSKYPSLGVKQWSFEKNDQEISEWIYEFVALLAVWMKMFEKIILKFWIRLQNGFSPIENPAPQKFTSQVALLIAYTCTAYGKRKHPSFAPRTWLRFFAI